MPERASASVVDTQAGQWVHARLTWIKEINLENSSAAASSIGPPCTPQYHIPTAKLTTLILNCSHSAKEKVN